MRWRTRLGVGLAAWLVVSAPVFAQAEKDALKAVPDDALGFVVLNRLETASQKIQNLAKQAKLPIPSPLGLAKVLLNIQKGLDDSGSIVVALFPSDDGPVPIPVGFVPVTNYKDLVKALNPGATQGDITDIQSPKGDALVAAPRGKFAVIAKKENLETLKKVLAGKTSIFNAVQPLHAWLAEYDVGGVVTTRGWTEISTHLRTGLNLAKGALGALPEEVQFLASFVDAFDGFLERAAKDITHLALGGKLDTQGNLHVNFQAIFAPGSNFAKTGGQVQPLDEGPIFALPGQDYILAAGGVFSEPFMKKLTSFSLDIIKVVAKDLTPDQLKKMESAYAGVLQGTRGMAIVIGAGQDKQALLHGLYSAIRVDDSARYMKAYEKSLRTLNEIYKQAKNPLLQEYEIKKMKIDGVTVMEASEDLGQNPGLDQLPGQFKQKLFGEGNRVTNTLGAADGKTILMRYGPADKFKEALQAYKSGSRLSKDSAMAKTTALLPRGSQWAGFLNLNGLVNAINRYGEGLLPVKLPEFPKTAPIGIGIQIASQGLQAHVVVPAEVITGIAGYAPKLKNLQPGGL